MAIPGGYSHTLAVALYGGAPVEYQIDGYLASVPVSASTNQKTVVQTVRSATKAHHLTWDEVENLLTKNS
jgi:hypothetical protein